MRQDPIMYIDPFYFKETCLAAYQYGIMPLEGPNQWPIITKNPIFPPLFVKPPGRPKMNRNKGPEEENKNPHKLPNKGTKMKCQKCFNFGHNKRTCKSAQTVGTLRPNMPPQKVIANYN